MLLVRLMSCAAESKRLRISRIAGLLETPLRLLLLLEDEKRNELKFGLPLSHL